MVDKRIAKRIVVVTLVVGLAILFKVLGLGQYFTLLYVKESQATLVALYVDHPIMVIAIYMAVYILVTSLSLPGAAIMTLAAGALRRSFRPSGPAPSTPHQARAVAAAHLQRAKHWSVPLPHLLGLRHLRGLFQLGPRARVVSVPARSLPRPGQAY